MCFPDKVFFILWRERAAGLTGRPIAIHPRNEGEYAKESVAFLGSSNGIRPHSV